MKLRILSRYLLAAFFIVAGANHFRDPATYLSMMPPWLPAPEALNFISGAAEIFGGIGLLVSRTRNAAALGLILLLIAIFPRTSTSPSTAGRAWTSRAGCCG